MIREFRWWTHHLYTYRQQVREAQLARLTQNKNGSPPPTFPWKITFAWLLILGPLLGLIGVFVYGVWTVPPFRFAVILLSGCGIANVLVLWAINVIVDGPTL